MKCVISFHELTQSLHHGRKFNHIYSMWDIVHRFDSSYSWSFIRILILWTYLIMNFARTATLQTIEIKTWTNAFIFSINMYCLIFHTYSVFHPCVFIRCLFVKSWKLEKKPLEKFYRGSTYRDMTLMMVKFLETMVLVLLL